MANFCFKCGAAVSEGEKFCAKCGAPMQAKQTPQPTQKPTQPVTPPTVKPQTSPPPSSPSASQIVKAPKSNALKIGAVIAIAVIVIIAAFGIGFMLGGSEDNEKPQGTEDYGIIMGRVSDTDGYKLGDVTVKANGNPVDTNDQGWFSISNVGADDRVIVEFERDGYATTQKVVDVNSGESCFIDAFMSPVDKSTTFDADSGATISLTSGGSVSIGSNDIVDSSGNAYNGDVDISLTVFDPTDPEDADAFPGEYLGVSNGEYFPLKSFGFADITLKDAYGNNLQLKSGETATITIPVPLSMQSEASSYQNCPLWYFDTDTGYWKQEGQGTYDSSSNSFTGTISHFSTWNFDVAYPRAFISGRVVNSAGDPVNNAIVNCWGPGWKYSRWASGETSTASDGTFNRIPVECNVIFKYQASKGGYDSTEYTIPRTLACNEEYDVGDIVLGSVSSAQITLTWGLNPDDLDSHLVIPENSGSGPFHLYYPKSMDDGYDYSDSYPKANLDTDDITSYGPEVVTILNTYPGTYRYCIRHYSGSGNIENSGAEINVIIQGIGIYKFTPPSGQPTDTDIWRVFDIVVDSLGTITKIEPINDYVSGGDESEYLYP